MTSLKLSNLLKWNTFKASWFYFILLVTCGRATEDPWAVSWSNICSIAILPLILLEWYTYVDFFCGLLNELANEYVLGTDREYLNIFFFFCYCQIGLIGLIGFVGFSACDKSLKCESFVVWEQ